MRSRRIFIGWLLAIAVLPAGLWGSEGSRPNVLFLAVDDLRVELGCYGFPHVISPHIDRLASTGTLFERAYCQQTVCNPSRASVLTGLRPDTLRVWDLPTHFRQNVPDVTTLPQFFMGQGYHAQCVGKIFHNWRQDEYRGDEPSWSVPSVLHYNSHGNDKALVKGELPPNLASGHGGTECRDVADEAYFDGRVAKLAVEALRDRKKAGQPFFLAVGFWKPHTPFNAPKRYWDLYDPESIHLPGRLTPPEQVPEMALTSARLSERDREHLREMHHGHLAAISYLDAQIGRVLEELEALDLRKDTIVVFWSDHGLHLGEHGLRNKTTLFELDAHVPLILAAPGFPGGRRTRALVELLDLYPTLVELCGFEALDIWEGKSLRPLLEEPDQVWSAAALTQTPRPNYPRGKMPKFMGYSIRTDRYRFTEWREFESGRTTARELYDHDEDPGETRNLIGGFQDQALLDKLHALLEKAKGEK